MDLLGWWLLVISFVCLLLFTGCGVQPPETLVFAPGNPIAETSAVPPTSPALSEKGTITLTAAGDILMHNSQIYSGLQADGSYRFEHFFNPVKHLIEEGDYASTCFEAAMAGPSSGYTGYPQFNSPDEMAGALKWAGFDLVVTAHNHIMDRGFTGAIRTMDILRKAGLETTGTFKSREEKEVHFIKEIRGVRVGYLAYSYGTNGIPVPREQPYFINFLDREKILADVIALRPKVDVLVLILHWGVEYSPKPTEQQRKLARQFLEAGADVILGSHPHVIQTMEAIKVGDKDKFVIYSMGNFIGDQRGLERNSGIVLKLKATKDFATGRTSLREVAYTPTYSHRYYEKGRLMLRVVPVEEAIRNIRDKKEPFLDAKDLPALEQVLAHTKKQLGEPFRWE